MSVRSGGTHRTFWTVFTGAVLGVLVSITSVGADAIGVTVLLLLYPRLATVRIVGSDVAHAVPLTLIAGAGHWMLGVDWSLLVSLLIGSIPGIAIGSMLSSKAPEALLRHARTRRTKARVQFDVRHVAGRFPVGQKS